MLSRSTKNSFCAIVHTLVLVNCVAALSIDNFDESLENYLAGELDNPCAGRKDGFARDLSSCERYFYCEKGVASSGVCNSGYVFDAETELCVSNDQANKVCFKCLHSKYYQLISVPKACSQYILCFMGKPKLHRCSNDLVFDGRNGIHQCNRKPDNAECHREEAIDLELSVCPPINESPIFYVDPNNRSV